MVLVAPDILDEFCKLSISLSGAGLGLGFLLWITGWLGHRFWIVLLATVVAGLFGLSAAPGAGVHPLLAGILLAIAAGLLALALVRVVAFMASGLATWVLMRAFAPVGWHDPMICCLAGGLFGLLLFRLWTMVLTGFVGSTAMAYFGLSLASSLGKLDAVSLAQQQPFLLNCIITAATLISLVIQFIVDRRRAQYQRRWEDREHQERLRWSAAFDQRRWWNRGQRRYYRAG